MITNYLLKEMLKTHLVQNECKGVYFSLDAKENLITEHYNEHPSKIINSLKLKLIDNERL